MNEPIKELITLSAKHLPLLDDDRVIPYLHPSIRVAVLIVRRVSQTPYTVAEIADKLEIGETTVRDTIRALRRGGCPIAISRSRMDNKYYVSMVD